MVDYYSTVEDVLEDTGLKPGDLGFKADEDSTADEKLEAKIIKWLLEAKGIIDEKKNRDFAAELAAGTITVIPVCISSIAKRIVINMAKQARINRDTPIVSKDDYNIQITNDTILTKSIKDDLEDCAVQQASTSFGMFRIDTSTTDEEIDEDLVW